MAFEKEGRYQERSYPVSKNHLLDLIKDMAALQTGDNVAEFRPEDGEIFYRLQMYGFQYEYRVFVRRDKSSCLVRIEADGNGETEEIGRQFAMLEKYIAQFPDSG
jgi:hypothetical protein